MDKARYFIAVMMAVMMPPAIAGWYIIHPFTKFWRRLGPVASFSIIYSILISVGMVLWEVRATLVGADLGVQPILLAAAIPLVVVGATIARRRRKHLNQRVLIGVPELSRTSKGQLLTEGIYSRTRNPRYLEFLSFAFAYTAFANYAGLWVMCVLAIPAIHLVVLLEEPELRARFGKEYEEYCRRVPRYIPNRRV